MGKRDYEQADLSVKQRGQGPGARVAQRTEHETVLRRRKDDIITTPTTAAEATPTREGPVRPHTSRAICHARRRLSFD